MSGFTTDRASFTQEQADKSYRCSGCGLPIRAAENYYRRPFAFKHKQTGWTRLHNLDGCWEDWDEATMDSIIMSRGNKTLRSHEIWDAANAEGVDEPCERGE